MRIQRSNLFRRFQVIACTAFVGNFSCIASLQAQDFEHIGPKQPPSAGPGHVVTEGAGKPLAANDNEVLVANLRGVFILSDPKQVRAEGVTSPRAIEPGDVPLAARPDFSAALQPYLGQAVTMKSLAELTRAIVAFYRAHDRSVVNVYVPQQNITTGFVQVVVLESHVEKVDATGARFFSNTWLRTGVRLHPGDPISSRQVRDDLSWINRNPFLQSDILLAPGDAPGTSDVLLRTKDRFPLRIYTGYEDSGNQFTGDNRILTGFNYGNLFGVGQQLSYQFTTDTDVNKFTAHSGTYIIPLPWRHQLTFFGSYADTNATIGPGFTSGGVNWQVSGRYEVPLPGSAHFTQSVIGGFDFKRNNNSLAFDVFSLANNTTDVDQLVASYQASYVDGLGVTSASATGFWSPGGISAYDNDTDYALQNAGRANYTYGQLTLDRVTRLPLDFTWTVRGLVQGASTNLVPSEQLGLGGYQTVRGYDEREANGDDGFLISTEVATPAVSIAQLFGSSAIKDQLQFLGFVDYGGTSLHHDAIADATSNPNANLLGVGPGLRYVITPYLSVRFDYGFQMIDTGFDTRHDSRAHIGVLISY